MELRNLAVFVALCLVAVSQCSETRHSVKRRDVFDDYDDNNQADEAGDDATQNDTDNGESAPAPIKKEQAVIITPPTSYEVIVGRTQRLECRMAPNGQVVTQWYKDNDQYFLNRIPMHPEQTRYSIAPNSTDLLIENVQVSDSGTFRCEALQREPVAINHTLLVTEKPTVTYISASSNSVGEGQELTISCTVTGSPVPIVMWSLTRKDHPNQRLSEKDGDFQVEGKLFTLYIRSVKKEQAGTYYCYAINNYGNDQAETVVFVKSKPRVHVKKTVVNSDLQIEEILECAAHDEPGQHIRWYKDDQLIEDSATKYKVSTSGAHSNLTVYPTGDNDFGTFTCEAENDIGKHNKSIELVQRPVVEELEVDGTKMSWVVHSYQALQEIEIQLRSRTQEGEGEWRRVSVPVPEVKRHKYQMSYLLENQQLDSGEYEAIVKVKNSNSWGGSNEPTLVKIEEEAQPQYIQHASVYRGNSAHSIRPLDIVLSTILMYLLVRLL